MYELKVLADPVRIEGPVSLEWFPTKKCKALLCYLGAAPGHRARRGALIADLWPEEFDDVARKALRQTLYHIRATLKSSNMDPDIVRSSTDHVWLDTDLARVDIDDFTVAAREGLENADPSHALPALKAAICACPSGFDGCDDGLWIAPERERIDDLLRRVRLRTAQVFLEQGDSRRAYELATGVIADNPYDEGAYEVGIRALLDLRDRAGARELYQKLELAVGQVLGGAPTIDWEEIASAYIASERPTNQHWEIAVPAGTERRRPAATRALAAIGLAAILLIGGWNARGVRGSQRSGPMAPSQGEAVLKASLQKQGASAADRITAVRRVFDAAWTGAYGASEDEWAAVIRKYREPILKTLKDAEAADPQAAVTIAGEAWRYFVNDGASKDVQAILQSSLARTPRKPSRDRARAMCALAFDIAETGKAQEALPLAREALAMYQQLEDRWGIAHANRCVGFAYAFLLDLPNAEKYYNAALDGFRSIGNREGMGVTQLCLSFVAGHYSETLRTKWTMESLDSYLTVDNKWGIDYASESLRYMVTTDGFRKLSRQEGARAAAVLERLVAQQPNPFSNEGIENRRAVVKLALFFDIEDPLSRQLEWFVRYQNLSATTVAAYYGSRPRKPEVWSWMVDRLRADAKAEGSLATAVAQGKQAGPEAAELKLRRELSLGPSKNTG